MSRWLLVALMLVVSASAVAQSQIYRCERANGTVEYGNSPTLPAGCKRINVENANVVTIPAVKAPPKSSAATAPASSTRSGDFPRVDNSTQRARDSDRRKILEDELKAQEERLAVLRREFNNGEPDPRGEDKSSPRYQDRVTQIRDEIASTEVNISSVKRELSNLAN